MSEERDVFFELAAFLGSRVFVKHAFDNFALENRLFDDFRNVFRLDVAVEESFRFKAHQRSFLAQTLAAGLGYVS